MTAEQRFTADALREVTARIFAGHGLGEGAAATVADNLVEADLRGVHSHGVTRVAIYSRRLMCGLLNPQPTMIRHDLGASLVALDGDHGMGAVVGVEAAAIALDTARRVGSAVVGVRRSNHFGVAGYYAERIASAGMLAVVCSTAPPTMAAWGGRTPHFGTNPLSYGVPTRRHPIVADMATSVVARGKIIQAAQQRRSIPAGWALDRDGRSTTEPAAALDGVVLPFGGAKGSAIAFLVDVLAGVATGAAFGEAIPDLYRDLGTTQDIGHFMMAIDPCRMVTREDYLDRVDLAIASLKAAPPAAGVEEVMLPGEIEHRLREERLLHGIPLHADTVADLAEQATALGLGMPSAL